MNGISSTLKDEIQKTKESKHKEKFKLLATIVLTNIMVALLCLSREESPKEKSIDKIFHPAHQMMVLPLSVMLAEERLTKESETKISLYTKDNQLISAKAYLHSTSRKDQEVTYFKIEIADSDLKKVSEHLGQEMVGIPYVEIPETKKLKAITKGSKYEINL